MNQRTEVVTANNAPRKPLAGQIERVYNALNRGAWLTLAEIHGMTGDPIPSVSAQIRHLRKPEHGSHAIRRRRRGPAEHGLFEYQLVRDEQ